MQLETIVPGISHCFHLILSASVLNNISLEASIRESTCFCILWQSLFKIPQETGNKHLD